MRPTRSCPAVTRGQPAGERRVGGIETRVVCQRRLRFENASSCGDAVLAQRRLVVVKELQNTEAPQSFATRHPTSGERARIRGCACHSGLEHGPNLPLRADSPRFTKALVAPSSLLIPCLAKQLT